MAEDLVVPDLYRLAFIPGCFRCPQCGFVLTKACLNPDTGDVGTREQERESEPCPNDGTMLIHVTYREQLEVYDARLREEFARFDAHTKAVAEFLSEMYAIMVDPLADGIIPVAEMMQILRETALEQREQLHLRS
jgi:hypothetical protein